MSAAIFGTEDPRLIGCDEWGFVPCERQVLYQSLPIAGSSIRLVYSSDRVPGRTIDPAPEVRTVGLAGWSLSVLRSLDRRANTMMTGLGEFRHVNPKQVSIGTGVLAVADYNGRRVDVFDAEGHDVAVYDALTGTRVLAFEWDTNGLRRVIDRGGVALTVVRDAVGTPVRLDSVRGPNTQLGVSAGWLAAVRDPLGGLTKLSTRSTGLLTGLTDSEGRARHFEYDIAGRLIARVSPAGARTTLTRVASADRSIVATKGPAGLHTVDTIQLRAERTIRYSHTTPAGVITTVDVSDNHHAVVLPDGRHVVMDLKPDPVWGMDAPMVASMSITDADATLPSLVLSETRTGQGTLGVPHPSSDSIVINGKVWKYDFDAPTRTLSAVYPSGRRRVTTYDRLGRVAAQLLGDTVVSTYRYDTAGRVALRTSGSGADARTWKYHYGNAGDLTITDPLGRKSVHRLSPTGALLGVSGPGVLGLALATDSTGLLTRFAGPGQGSYWTTRRTDGQPAATTAPAGDNAAQYVLYEYDDAGRSIRATWPDAVQSVERDAAERIMSIDYGAGKWSLTYDEAGHVTTTSGPGAKVTETYHGARQVSERTLGPFDVTQSRTVDALGRTTSETIGSRPPVKYAYDDTGLLETAGNLRITREPRTGRVRSEQLGTLTRTWTYDQFGEPMRQTVVRSNTIVADVKWQRDALGRIVGQSEQIGSADPVISHFNYDPSGRLMSWSLGDAHTSYEYDQASNLVAVTNGDGVVTRANYDPRNDLLVRGSAHYQYNGAGQLTTRAAPDGTTTFRYDRRGALLSIGQPAKPVIEFTIDALGRRVAKSVGGKVVNGIVYHDALRPSAELDATGSVALQYVYTGEGQPAYVAKDGTDYLEVSDGTGSPLLVVNGTTGTIAEALSRDPFGLVISDTAPGFQLIGFAGGLADSDSGLVRFGARDYDPQTGRWTAPDPLGVAGGSPNLQIYVGADPVNRTDRAGRCDLMQTGGTATLVLGPGGLTFSGGVAFAHSQWGLYGTLGLAVGAEAGLTTTATCVETGNHESSIEQLGGSGEGFDLGLGLLSVGADVGNGGTVGAHAGMGAAFGVGYGETYTWVTPGSEYSISDEPAQSSGDQGDCGGMDAGLCDPSPDDPNIGAADDPSSPGNICNTGGTCNDPGSDARKNAAGARSTGDPHIRTLDSKYYDFMAAGEFIALKSDSGDLVVQVRQQPLPHSRVVSLTSAVAIKVAGDRMLASVAESGELDVAANASPLRGTGSFVLPHGTHLTRTPTELVVRVPDGGKIEIKTNPMGLDINAVLPESRRGHVQGLFGPFGKLGAGADVRSRDGTPYTIEQLRDYDTLYRRYGDSWRVAQPESLFAYGRGQTTASFTDMGFPDRVGPQISSDRQAAAERLCRGLTLIGEAESSCAMDVAVTGDAGFAVSTAAAVDVSAGSRSQTQSPSGQFVPGGTISGHLAADASVVFPINVAAGTVGYFAAPRSCHQSNSLRWTIESDDGSKSLGISPICSDIGRIIFAADAGYRLRVYSSDASTGDYRLTWNISRPDGQWSLRSGAAAEGAIDLPGANDVYDLESAAGTVGYFAAAPGCHQSGSLRWVIEKDDGSKSLGISPICSDIGRIAFIADGRYRLRVYSSDASTGEYRVTWNSSRPDGQRSLRSGAVAAGAIDLPGANDVYELEGAAGTVGYFAAAPACHQSNSLRWIIEKDDGSKILGISPICSDIGRVTFAPDGQYRLRVYSSDASTGVYGLIWKTVDEGTGPKTK